MTWGSVWAGIAAGAVARAQQFLRRSVRGAQGHFPPGAANFTRASAALATLRGMLASGLQSYEAARRQATVQSLEFQTMINLAKVEAAELSVSIVMGALRACGLSGYRADDEFSLCRHLRDVLSAPLMISNDRILANCGTAALLSPVPAGLGSAGTIELPCRTERPAIQ